MLNNDPSVRTSQRTTSYIDAILNPVLTTDEFVKEAPGRRRRNKSGSPAMPRTSCFMPAAMIRFMTNGRR